MKYCENCKEFLPEKDNYCPLCGRKLTETKGGTKKESKANKSDVLLEDYNYEDTFRDW